MRSGLGELHAVDPSRGKILVRVRARRARVPQRHSSLSLSPLSVRVRAGHGPPPCSQRRPGRIHRVRHALLSARRSRARRARQRPGRARAAELATEPASIWGVAGPGAGPLRNGCKVPMAGSALVDRMWATRARRVDRGGRGGTEGASSRLWRARARFGQPRHAPTLQTFVESRRPGEGRSPMSRTEVADRCR